MIAGTTQGAIKQRAHRAYLTLRGMLAKPDGATPLARPAGQAGRARKDRS